MDMKNLEKLLQELQEAQGKAIELERQVHAAKEEAKNAEMKKIADQLTTAGIGIHELARFMGIPVETSTARTTAPKKAPAPPKFKNPATGETHSGRGQLPAWLKEARDAGTMEDFRIK